MESHTKSTVDVPKWSALLVEAVNKPGLIMQAYSAFHQYSVGNQLLALVQCQMRGLEPGPINTFPGWQAFGRSVKRGERALVLCMPITCKRGSVEPNDNIRSASASNNSSTASASNKSSTASALNNSSTASASSSTASANSSTASTTSSDGEGNEPHTYTAFVHKPRWFVLSQTIGEEFTPPTLPQWDTKRALDALDIEQIPFTETDGNCQGFARKRQIAINPVAQLPHKTLFHEAAHVILGHTAETDFTDTERTPRSLREVEAEAVALLCCEALNLEGAEFCRGYIQNWIKPTMGYSSEPIPEKSAQKIFRAADQILRAGRPQANQEGDQE